MTACFRVFADGNFWPGVLEKGSDSVAAVEPRGSSRKAKAAQQPDFIRSRNGFIFTEGQSLAVEE
jgi:hypothetical protein